MSGAAVASYVSILERIRNHSVNKAMPTKQLNEVVIVGAGQASLQLAVSLRQRGFPGNITLISNEPGLPYQRPPLSKAYLARKVDRDGLLLRPAKFFSDQEISLVHGHASAIDRSNQRVQIKSGQSFEYDHLVLATGAQNRRLPVSGAELDGVFGLRTVDDADTLIHELDKVRNIVIVGAGFIGLEFATMANARGLEVHVIDTADRPMRRSITPEMAAFFRQHHKRSGIRFDFQQGVKQIHGKRGRVTAVETTDGCLLAADLVVCGIGVLPNVELAAEAGLDIHNGIRTDSYLLTSDPSISAIGDGASFPSPHAETLIRLESVQNAVDQARNVAARLTGKAEPYTAMPWFWTEQGDLKLQIVGLLTGYDTTVSIGDPDQAQFSILCFRKDRLVAVESVNRMADHMAARRLLARQTSLSPREAAEPWFSLKDFEVQTA